MYGDPDVLRSRVDALREQAVDVRAMADHLIAQTEGIGWTGRAAEAMRERVGDRAAHLRAAAAQHDVAADALASHAKEVEMLQETIASIERRYADLVAEARTRAARRAAADPDGHDEADGPDGRGGHDDAEVQDDEALLAFDAPPPGHRAWLDAEVPGL